MNITILEKSELSSVVFVRDYLQFVFEGEHKNVRLSSFTLPNAVVNGVEHKENSDGWRDALCSLINKVVKEATAVDGELIKIIFEDGDGLEISLQEDDYEGPEAAMLYEENENGQWMVW
jgi:hypothetical protein